MWQRWSEKMRSSPAARPSLLKITDGDGVGDDDVEVGDDNLNNYKYEIFLSICFPWELFLQNKWILRLFFEEIEILTQLGHLILKREGRI